MNLTIDESRFDDAAAHLAERVQLMNPQLNDEQAVAVATRALKRYGEDLMNERTYDVTHDVMPPTEARILRQALEVELRDVAAWNARAEAERAAHLVDRVWPQVEDAYQRGRLDFETLNADYILRLEIDGVELEDIIDASHQPGLKTAATLEAEKAISDLRREAAADEREYRLKMRFPYSY